MVPTSQPELNLAENEKKGLNAGRIPYESYKVSGNWEATRPSFPHPTLTPSQMVGARLV